MRAPMVVRWPGHIEPGTVKTDIFASLDWLPTLVDIAGGPKGNDLKAEIEKGAYPGIVKTTLDGVNQRDYLEGKSDKSARDTFFYYSGKDPSAVRYKNWKMYFAMVSDDPTGFLAGVLPYHWTQVVNIKRDPFETSIGEQVKTLTGMGGALAGPVTAYVYDWNMLPIGQALWLKELETYNDFPPMQDPASYNLEQVIAAGPGDEEPAAHEPVDGLRSSVRRPKGGRARPFRLGHQPAHREAAMIGASRILQSSPRGRRRCAHCWRPLRAQDAGRHAGARASRWPKTIGQVAQTGPVPSLFVLNARGATLADGKLTLTGASPNSIVFADRPVRAAGHIETAQFIETWLQGEDQFDIDPPNATVSVLGRRRLGRRCGGDDLGAGARGRNPDLRRGRARRRPDRRHGPGGAVHRPRRLRRLSRRRRHGRGTAAASTARTTCRTTPMSRTRMPPGTARMTANNRTVNYDPHYNYNYHGGYYDGGYPWGAGAAGFAAGAALGAAIGPLSVSLLRLPALSALQLADASPHDDWRNACYAGSAP